ncbi:hypothetical protein [Kluyvera intermedia]|uniref:hypothetical protein n=1 Tax=Kluyvera intermedia TaxID=61648 RepID=UPI0013DF98C5|nr:hypothetical protein [Kluyvera intermedia]WQD29393.1 hypothetical protein U0026_20790 [Kluyvera intermedia]
MGGVASGGIDNLASQVEDNVRVRATSAGFAAPGWGLRASGGGFQKLCWILTVGYRLLNGSNIRLIRRRGGW